ncbi:MAG TPA: hypothetical protein VL547_08830 [Dinghuibacter sp.]|uniref:hypothetical protein n=1 Tax=Dinghuibacter sp. TaxID=2024697 RepID=UPI002B6F39C4|nr:hypothetical protein [Dinghuibacter sp.]HTJ12117.1 hypothetical protein [Dinghuibacter sp.]
MTQRTSLRPFPAEVPVFRDHFSIAFDLSLWDKANLGYVFDVLDKDNSYSLSYIYDLGRGYLNLNIDSKSNKIRIPLETALLKKKNWIKIRADFDLKGDAVTVTVDSTAYHADKMGFREEMPANLVFGKNPRYTEVPNMAIKDLYVGNEGQHFFFPLDEWSGNSVHEAGGSVIGSVENPVWLINESFFWKPVYAESFPAVAGLNFDPLRQDVFIFTGDSLITYNPDLRRVSAMTYANKLPVKMVLGKSIFNARENKLYLYELFDEPRGAPSVASLDMDSGSLKWTPIGKTVLPGQLHHHNIFYDDSQHRFYLFGGYGLYSYHNAFLSYNDSTDTWDKVAFTGDTICPRFFSATGPSDKPGEILLFGGYGNESGSQVVGGKQYYDLYRINLNDHSIKRCWSTTPPDKSVFVPANNLVLSPDKRFFYALCYPHEVAKTELKLYKFSIADGSYEVVSAPVPVTSMRIESDINLFYSERTEEFFCAIQEFADRQRSMVRLYTLAAPPVPVAVYLRSLQPATRPSLRWMWWLILAPLAVGSWWLFRPRVRKPAIAPPETAPPAPAVIQQNAIYLLGEFAAFDREGRDITHLFSPKIKQLFVLILLNSLDGKGIVSKKVSAKLWPDKDVAKSKNIKGVTFNHLRNIISDIDGVELVFQNDTYSFTLGEAFICDFCVLTEAIRHRPESLTGYLHLLTRGPLLPDMPEPILDHHKTAFEEQLIDLLLPAMVHLYDTRELKTALEVAKLVLTLDAFNEEALKYQLRIYRRLKGIEYSRKAYDQFTQDYERSLGVAYHVSFDKILQ